MRQIFEDKRMTGIGPRLKRERVRLKLSQSALGAIGGVEANAQGNYENGLRSPRADYLSKLSEVGIDVNYVITGRKMPAPANDNATAESESLLEQTVSGLHASLHGMNQHLYQLARLLEARQGQDEDLDHEYVQNLCKDAEAISLAAVRLIYNTARTR